MHFERIMSMIKNEVKNAIKEIKGIHSDSVKIIKFALIFFNILVIAGVAVTLFPRLAGSELASVFAADDLLNAACRTLALGVSGALLIDLMTRRNRAQN